MRSLIVLAACSAALLIAACGGGSTSPPAAAKGDGLPELTSIGQLQRAFDAHPDVPRLVILLSPT